jgi:hypothetical protein
VMASKVEGNFGGAADADVAAVDDDEDDED